MDHALNFTEVTCRTKERHKYLHTISQVFVPKFVSWIYIPKYTFNVLHYHILIWLPLRVI